MKRLGDQKNERTESIKAGEVTVQRPGVGDLGVDCCNCVRRATDERRASVEGSGATRRQGNVLPTDGDPWDWCAWVRKS